MIDWLIHLFIHSLIGWLIKWLIHWFIRWLVDWLISWFIGWLIDSFIHSFIDRLIDWVVDSLDDWLIHWLIDWFTDRLIDWLVTSLIDWLLVRQCVVLAMQSRVYAELGSVAECNKSAAEFHQLDQQFPAYNAAASLLWYTDCILGLDACLSPRDRATCRASWNRVKCCNKSATEFHHIDKQYSPTTLFSRWQFPPPKKNLQSFPNDCITVCFKK